MSELICSCELDYDEAVGCYRETIRKARKEHTCCECGEPIKPGQRYEYVSGIDHDGRPFWQKTCLPCAQIWEDFFDGRMFAIGGGGCLSDYLWECRQISLTSSPDEDDWEEIDAEAAAHVESARRRRERALKEELP